MNSNVTESINSIIIEFIAEKKPNFSEKCNNKPLAIF